ncbi:MAG: CDGSH iron-sulfur domain-containing protein [Thermoplasmatota archaeon]
MTVDPASKAFVPPEAMPARSGPGPKVAVSKDGPLVVSGNVPLRIQTIQPNAEGFSWDWVAGKSFKVEDSYALCRCGNSRSKPFCDGSHARTRFDGAETASRRPFARQAEHTKGEALALDDVEGLCAFARFCDPGGKIWGLIREPDDPETRKLIIREANHCPSGRLVVHDNATQKPIEHKLEPAIGVVEDPALKVSGPLWLQGGIPVESSDGKRYEIRNRIALCRCGASANKPFCNGGHASIGFDDGMIPR